MNVKVHDDLSLSDHRLITFNLVYQGFRSFCGRMNLNKTRKWKLVSDISHLFDLINLELDKRDPENIIDMVTKGANHIYRSNLIKSTKKRKDALWWHPALDVERKRVRALRRRYQLELDTNKKIEYQIRFKEARAKYKKNILYKKRVRFKQFVSNITTSSTFGSGYKIIKDKRKNNCLCDRILKDDGTFTDNIGESRSEILKYNFRTCSLGTYVFTHTIEEDNKYNDMIQIWEVEHVLADLKINKAPGPDNLSGDMVKLFFNLNKQVFTYLLNKIWTSKRFPDCWKIANVALIPKEGKDLKLRDSYRPICLLPI